MKRDDAEADEQPKLLTPLAGMDLMNAMAPPPTTERMVAFFRAQNRRQLLEGLARAYRAYARKPNAPGRTFSAMRALVRACHAHDMTIEHAALFALMGQVGESAIAPVKLTLTPRPETKAMRQRENKRDKRDNARRLTSRNREIFRAVLFHVYENDSAESRGVFSESFGPVGEQYNLGEDSVRKIFQAEGKTLRLDGTGAVLFERGDKVRVIPIPQGPGRIPKNGSPKRGMDPA